LWVIDAIKSLGPVKLWVIVAETLQQLGARHFRYQQLDLFASYIVLGIFLTAQSIDALRFQRS